jgi:benzoate membrane transport protein
MAGLAAIKSFGYQSNADRLLFAASLASALAALLGGHALNLAAITASICLGPQAAERPEDRWKAAAWAGVLYLLLACFALTVIHVLAWMNPVLVLTLASIALISSMTSALQQAYEDNDIGQNLPQTVCLLVVLSGVNIAGLGAVFWALCFGMFAMLVQNLKRKP